MRTMRVLIFGGRRRDGQVSREEDHLFGTDWQSAVWAERHRIPVRYFYANWPVEKKAAGPVLVAANDPLPDH